MREEQETNSLVAEAPAAEKPKDKNHDKAVAYTLWIFVGFFGVHRFWWGKCKTGLAMLLLPFVGLGMVFGGSLDVLAKWNESSGSEVLAAGGVAIVGLLMILGCCAWTVIDSVLIFFWDPRP